MSDEEDPRGCLFLLACMIVLILGSWAVVTHNKVNSMEKRLDALEKAR